jgi:hypothetical protein
MLHVAVAIVLFLAVTFGLKPMINLSARLRSPNSYSQYDMSGTWFPALIVAAGYLGVVWAVSPWRRRRT